jgi:hemoglobin-like flavoprotein
MTPEQITLVKTTWAKVVPIKDKAAELFYGKLFEIDPALKPLFKGDIVEQGNKLMMTINTVVNALDKIEPLVPVVQDLGRRHVKYGVKDKDYDSVGAALLWTLGAGLGEAFTPPVKTAWTEAYTLLATVMKAATNEAVPA